MPIEATGAAAAAASLAGGTTRWMVTECVPTLTVLVPITVLAGSVPRNKSAAEKISAMKTARRRQGIVREFFMLGCSVKSSVS